MSYQYLDDMCCAANTGYHSLSRCENHLYDLVWISHIWLHSLQVQVTWLTMTTSMAGIGGSDKPWIANWATSWPLVCECDRLWSHSLCASALYMPPHFIHFFSHFDFVLDGFWNDVHLHRINTKGGLPHVIVLWPHWEQMLQVSQSTSPDYNFTLVYPFVIHIISSWIASLTAWIQCHYLCPNGKSKTSSCAHPIAALSSILEVYESFFVVIVLLWLTSSSLSLFVRLVYRHHHY